MELQWQQTIGRFVAHGRKLSSSLRIGIVAEEADEAVLWLELLIESGVVEQEKAGDLLNEAKELAAIFTASQQTSKKGSRF